MICEPRPLSLQQQVVQLVVGFVTAKLTNNAESSGSEVTLAAKPGGALNGLQVRGHLPAPP